ncbi:C40 family peptidase [Nocardioides sp.]|uniref:C40 family peptidase n=1 Tax=Nocardioides sp. TaxID=35761 RepID=UPI00378377D7
MRTRGAAAALALALVTGGALAGAAAADDHDVPTRQDVRDARAAVGAAADSVAAVRAQLVVANQQLQQSAIAAAQASEAYNGARWRAAEARRAAQAARERSQVAATDVRRQQQTYGDALVSSYEMAPELSALSAIVRSDGIGTVVDRTTSLRNAQTALDDNYDRFRASAVLATVAEKQAAAAEDDATAAARRARDARDAAQAAADQAAAQAAAIAEQKTALIQRLAELQHVSVALAERRQSALEQRAAAAAAAAAEAEREQQAAQEQAAQEQAAQEQTGQEQAAQEQTGQQAQDQAQDQARDPQAPSAPDPSPAPSSPPPAPDPAPPAPASGVGAAIAFARAQIGEPYVWGAAGPSSWDCSGLTMGAWRAGGKYLPHYSVAQYEQSTPISAGQLQPGDLVFWGSSSNPSSIYHVALYVGGGQIIQAPRTGRDVEETSMYYWITPNFYARP